MTEHHGTAEQHQAAGVDIVAGEIQESLLKKRIGSDQSSRTANDAGKFQGIIVSGADDSVGLKDDVVAPRKCATAGINEFGVELREHEWACTRRSSAVDEDFTGCCVGDASA